MLPTFGSIITQENMPVCMFFFLCRKLINFPCLSIKRFQITLRFTKKAVAQSIHVPPPGSSIFAIALTTGTNVGSKAKGKGGHSCN